MHTENIKNTNHERVIIDGALMLDEEERLLASTGSKNCSHAAVLPTSFRGKASREAAGASLFGRNPVVHKADCCPAVAMSKVNPQQSMQWVHYWVRDAEAAHFVAHHPTRCPETNHSPSSGLH